MPLSPVFVEYQDRLFGAAKPIAIPIYRIGRSAILVWNLPVVVMCGRYANFLPAEAIAKMFGTVNTLPNITPIWNMAPTRSTARPHFNTSRWRSPGFGRSGQSTHPSSGRTGCSLGEGRWRSCLAASSSEGAPPKRRRSLRAWKRWRWASARRASPPTPPRITQDVTSLIASACGEACPVRPLVRRCWPWPK